MHLSIPIIKKDIPHAYAFGWQGYDRFLQDLLQRSSESLQLLRSDRGMQYPGSVEVIVEITHELSHLHDDNKELKAQVRVHVHALPYLPYHRPPL